jgi:CDP-diacylglycerol--glycerol-3-phosphate 3-phosphatidyltransferase
MLLARRHIPNALTVLRLVLAAGFFAALSGYHYPAKGEVAEGQMLANVAVLIFIAAAVTDALDGYFARRWQVISTFGRIMDPFCDKVLVLGAFVYLAGPRFVIPEAVAQGTYTMATAIYPWMVVLILARELLVTGIRGVVESGGTSFGSMWSGKAKMILQSITVPALILLVVNFSPSTNQIVRIACHALVWITLVVTVWSGLPYVMGMRSMDRASADDAG